jgi:hypothetical protein
MIPINIFTLYYQAKAAANLKFLNEALTNIEDLVGALSLRIDELDEEEAQAQVEAAQFAAQPPSMQNKEEAQAIAAAAEERREKRAQLELLKENVSVLAENIQTLVEKAQAGGDEEDDAPLLVLDDMEKIESVITETATMLMMLTQSEEEEVLPDDVVQEDEQGLIHEETVRLEDQMSAMDAMVSSVELLSLADELLGEESFEGIEFAHLNMEDVVVKEGQNFKAQDPTVRPEFWKEVRMRRILVKECVDRMEGLDLVSLKQKRRNRIEEVINSSILLHHFCYEHYVMLHYVKMI